MFQIKGTIIGDQAYPWNKSKFDFAYEQTVSITEYYYPDLSFAEFISSIGGSLGFWLGVGVLQIGEHGIHIIAKFKSCFQPSNS